MKPAPMMLLTALPCAAMWVQPSLAQPSCVEANARLPPRANTTDRSAPFFIDVAGLDFATAPPTRDPATAAYPRASELPDGAVPPVDGEGNFVIGPTHAPAPETVAGNRGPHGTVRSFTITSAGSVVYNPGFLRDDPPGCRNGSIYAAATAPGDASNLVFATSHPGTWTRVIDVYVPPGYVAGAEMPFIVYGDGGARGSFPGQELFTVLDNLIQQRRVPPVIAIGIGAGGQDAQGSERGREYDTVSGAYAEWVESEVLPLVERTVAARLTKNPDGRATMGISSSGAAAFTMAWFHPELYHRVLAYSPTMVNQQWPHDPALRGGAWEFHAPWAGPSGPTLDVALNAITPSTTTPGAPLIPNNPAKPIRFWFEVGDQDLFYPNPAMADGMHDWVLADEGMAKALASQGYHYQFVFARNARHVDQATVMQTLPAALEWLWKGYPGP